VRRLAITLGTGFWDDNELLVAVAAEALALTKSASDVFLAVLRGRRYVS
jgi:hypothetical protein